MRYENLNDNDKVIVEALNDALLKTNLGSLIIESKEKDKNAGMFLLDLIKKGELGTIKDYDDLVRTINESRRKGLEHKVLVRAIRDGFLSQLSYA